MTTSQLLEEYGGVASEDLDVMDLDEFISAMLVHAPADILRESFSPEEADLLESYAHLIESEAFDVLTEDEALQLEGIRKLIGKVKEKVKSKIPPGMKMVFGKLVKVGKAVGKGAKAAGKAAVATGKAVGKAAKAVGKAGAAVGRTAVKAKRGAQARTYAFSKAGKEARKLAKEVRKTHGREAAEKIKKASKETYQKASRAGETAEYARGQAAAAGKGASKKVTKAKYYDDDDEPEEKPKAKDAAPAARKGNRRAGGRRPPPRGFQAKAAAKQAGRTP